jgi:drug/metabolite transporter (DMT)-like permease
MSPQVISQLLGVALAVITAAGCLAYERLAQAYSYFWVGMLVSLSYAIFWIASLPLQSNAVRPNLWEHRWAIVVFLLSGATGPIWYYVARKQGILVASTYEMKYVVVLGIFYMFFGEHRVTPTAAMGVIFAVLSVICLSKS